LELTCKILKESKTVAVVGISDKVERDSGRIADLLKRRGYNVVGVHPKLKEVFGIPVYASLRDIPQTVDLVDVFLSSDKIPNIMEDVLAIKPKYLWFQLGIWNDEAASLAEQNNIPTIQNKCVAIELRNCG